MNEATEQNKKHDILHYFYLTFILAFSKACLALKFKGKILDHANKGVNVNLSHELIKNNNGICTGNLKSGITYTKLFQSCLV